VAYVWVLVRRGQRLCIIIGPTTNQLKLLGKKIANKAKELISETIQIYLYVMLKVFNNFHVS